MFKSILVIFALMASSIAAPAPEFVVERHLVDIYKRQADISQLLELASLAGVTALPTDPAVLLQLGPVANSLASALPTSSVLDVLLTAAPSGFVSSIVNDPSYASSFESAFSAGNSPEWFNSLPTSVRSYLHTYSGFGGLAGAGAAIKSVNAEAGNGTAAVTGSGTSSKSSTTQNSAESAASVSSASAAYVAAADGTATGTSKGGVTAPTQTGTASVATGGAARPSGAGVAGWVGVAGLVGVAAVLCKATYFIPTEFENLIALPGMAGRLPEEAQRMQDSAAERGLYQGNNAIQTAGFGDNPANGSLYPFDTTTAAGIVYGGGSNTAHHTFNGGSNPLGGLTAPVADFGHGNYASEGDTYSGFYPVDDFAPTVAGYHQGNPFDPAAYAGSFDSSIRHVDYGLAPSAIYNQGNPLDPAPYAGSSDSILHHMSSGLAPSAVYNQANHAGLTPYAGSPDSSLHHMSSGLAPTTVYDQVNHTGLTPYAGSSDSSLHYMSSGLAPNTVYNQANYTGLTPYAGNSFYPLDEGATRSAVRHGSGNPRYDTNSASVHGGFFPLTGFPAPDTAYVGANTGPQIAVRSLQVPSLTPGIGPIGLPASTPAGSETVPNGQSRWACQVCPKTFGRESDMHRHAKKHTSVREFQCDVAGCRYKGSYRQDNLEQHRRNCH